LLCTMVWLRSSHAHAQRWHLSPSLSLAPPRVVLLPTNEPPAPEMDVEPEEVHEMTIEPLDTPKQHAELMATAPPAPEVSSKHP